ncbi:hypothetical protein EV715DRAFT_202446 [Schizophyllum commune]
MDDSSVHLCERCDATLKIPRMNFGDDVILQYLRALPASPIPLSGIDQDIVTFQSTVGKLQEEIDGTAELLKVLNKNMSFLNTYISRLRSTRAPVRRLPNEILHEVFSLVVDGEYSLHDFQSVPSTLSQVCLRWRGLINSKGAYWASITLRRPELPELDPDSRIDDRIGVGLELHFRKSALEPLKLQLGRYVGPNNVDLLLSQAWRWRDCSIDHSAVLEWLSSADHLDQLHIMASLNLARTGGHTLQLEKVASLREYSGPLADVVLPWHQLAALTLTSTVSTSEVILCLQKCTSLVSLSVESLWPHEEEEAHNEADLTHACLRRLRLRSMGNLPVEDKSLFTYLTTPNLSAVELYGHHYIRQWDLYPSDVTAFSTCLQRSEAHIRSLILQYVYVDDGEIETMLSSMPELVDLEVCDYVDALEPLPTRSAVSCLLWMGKDQVVPHLAHLTFTSLRVMEIEFLSLLVAVAAHRSARRGGSLCSVTLSGTDMRQATEAASSMLVALEQLVNVHIRPPPYNFDLPVAIVQTQIRLGRHLTNEIWRRDAVFNHHPLRQLSFHRRYNEDVLERLRGLSVDPLPDIDKEVLKNERAERDLQEQVFRTEKLLRDLRRQLTATQDYLRRIRSVDSPVHRLPYEILDDIFALAITEGENAYSFHGMHSITTQLAHVCTRWRQRVLSSGALWASISIHRVHLPPPVTPYDKEYMRKLIDAGVQRHLRHSQGAPLRLHVGSFAEPEPIRYLLEAAPRWQEVSAEHEAMFEALNDVKVQGKLGKLRALQLVRIGPAPLRLKLDGLSALRVYNGPHIGVSLPWQQLTSLTLPKVLQTPDLIMCLKLCQALTFLSVERQAPTLPPNVTIDTIVHHPCLREVQLRTKSTVRADACVFTYLNAPRLSSVSFGGFHVGQAWRGWDASQANTLKECLSRSNAQLRSLSFAYVHVEPPVLEDLLDSLPELEFLEIKDTTDAGIVVPGMISPPPATPLSHSVIKALLPHGSADTLRAPRLAYLALTIVEKQPFGEEIRSAMHGVVERRSIRLGGSLLALSLSSTLDLESAVTADEVMASLPTVEDLVDAYTANRRFPPRVPVKKPSYEKLK